MKRRTLGKAAALDAPAIGLGCMSMTPIYGTPDPASARATIQRALDLGCNMLDTADAYAGGKNEQLVGEAIKGRRNEVIIASKFGNFGAKGANGRPEYVVEACEKSLKNLGVETIDLYYQHRIDPAVPVEETVGAMSRLVEQGKVRFLGLSEAGVETIRRAHATAPIAAVQTEYSLFTRIVEDDILPTCRELGIGFVAYSPLGRGFLTGTISGSGDLAENDRRREHPRYQDGNIENNVSLVAPLVRAAEKAGVTPGQMALAWLLSRGPDIVPIPGTSKVARLEENLAAADLEIDQAVLDEVGREIEPDRVAGTRYPEVQMGMLGL